MSRMYDDKDKLLYLDESSMVSRFQISKEVQIRTSKLSLLRNGTVLYYSVNYKNTARKRKEIIKIRQENKLLGISLPSDIFAIEIKITSKGLVSANLFFNSGGLLPIAPHSEKNNTSLKQLFDNYISKIDNLHCVKLLFPRDV